MRKGRRAAKPLGAVPVKSVAKEVRGSLLRVDGFSSIEGRAGAVPGGYVEPEQAACDVCEEAVRPFLDDVERRLKSGDLSGAWDVCRGVMLGLYQVKGARGGVLEYAGEDFFGEAASYALETYRGGYNKKGKPRRSRKAGELSDAYLQSVPEWSDWLSEHAGGRTKR